MKNKQTLIPALHVVVPVVMAIGFTATSEHRAAFVALLAALNSVMLTKHFQDENKY